MQSRATFTKRMIARLAICAVTVAPLCACSPGVVDSPAFPAIHDMPAPRVEAPMNAEQVKQATDVLMTERSQLNTEAQHPGQADTPPTAANTTGSIAPAVKNKKAAPVPAPAAAIGSTQAAGTDAKP